MVVQKKIVFKVISKTKQTKPIIKSAESQIQKLRKKGFRSVMFTDFKLVGKVGKKKGVGIAVIASKGKKKTPKGFRTANFESF